jgi:RimJ/RimL family protein N-acetyltransferase
MKLYKLTFMVLLLCLYAQSAAMAEDPFDHSEYTKPIAIGKQFMKDPYPGYLKVERIDSEDHPKDGRFYRIIFSVNDLSTHTNVGELKLLIYRELHKPEDFGIDGRQAELFIEINRLHQGQGFGKSALRVCAGIFKRHFPDVRYWTLDVAQDNLRAIGLYERFGFIRTPLQPYESLDESLALEFSEMPEAFAVLKRYSYSFDLHGALPDLLAPSAL